MPFSSEELFAHSPPTTTVYVLESIRNDILNGHHPLGSRLDQKAIAEDLGVSLVPVREALRMLEGEGIVKIYPRRGAFVTDISTDELEEIYLIREELEELATKKAVPNLTSQHLAELSQIIEQMEETTAHQGFAQLMELNQRFHFTIYNASNLPLLSEMMTGLWVRSSLYRRVFTYIPTRAVQALEEHKDIYAACRAGDSEAAGKAVRWNIRQTVEALLDEFQKSEKLSIQTLSELHQIDS